MAHDTCGFEKDDGDHCATRFGLCDDCGRCWTHCEHRAAERAAARERGGLTTADKRRKYDPVEAQWALETHEDCKRWLGKVARLALAKKVEPKVVHAVCRCVEIWIEAEAEGAAREEIDEIKSQLAELQKGNLKAV